MKKFIIFDLDGTLLNTLDDLTNSTNYALASCGYPTHNLQAIRQFVGNGVANLIHTAMPSGHSEEEFNKCFAAFKAHYKDHCKDLTCPYDGITQLLEALKERSIGMAIVSNKLDSAVKELNTLFFSNYIDVAIGETTGTKRKPAPDMIFKAMDLLKADKNQCIYIGDSDVDIVTAKNAGIPCISVLWGFRDHDFLENHGAKCFVHTPLQLLTTIEEMA